MDLIGSAPTCRFGTGPQRYLPYDAGDSSNDLLLGNPDNQETHYPRTKVAFFPTDTRDNYRNSFLMTVAPEILLGSQSPGPSCYKLPGITGNDGCKLTMGPKTKSCLGNSMTPASMGPGSFEVPPSIGIAQVESQKVNQSVHAFGRERRACVPDSRRSRSIPVPKMYPSVPSVGPQRSSLRRTEQRGVIGSSTRSMSSKERLVRTQWDYHPEKTERVRISHPGIMKRSELLRWAS